MLLEERESNCWNWLESTTFYDVEQTKLTSSIQWGEPKEIRTELLPVPQMLAEMLPEPIRAWVEDEAHRLNCPIEAMATSVIFTLGGLIGTACVIQPKRNDTDWVVTSNIWSGVVGRPGIILKTPMFKKVMRPIYALEDRAEDEHKHALKNHDAEIEVYKGQREMLGKTLRTPDCKDINRAKEQYAALIEPPKPPQKRYILNDTTVPKATELLQENPRGLIQFRDELTGWLASLDREDRREDRAFYLETHDGEGRKNEDRIERGTKRLRSLCLTVIGGIQPAKLERYLFESIRGFDNDGLFQRFSGMVYPDEPPTQIIDKSPNEAARNRAIKIIEKIATMDFWQIAEPSLTQEGVPRIRFNDDAQQFFLGDWLCKHCQKQKQEPIPIVQEHLAKYQKLMAGLCLIFHVIKVADELCRIDAFNEQIAQCKSGSDIMLDVASLSEQIQVLKDTSPRRVEKETAKLAAAFCELLEAHARRIYGLVSTPALKAGNCPCRKNPPGQN